jgi:hypothetical protein
MQLYQGDYYPGLILKKDHKVAEIRSMINAGFGSWKWPAKEDVLLYYYVVLFQERCYVYNN